MSVYFSICVSLSVGLILGAVGGGVKKKLIKKDYTQKQIARNIKFISKAAGLFFCWGCSGAAIISYLALWSQRWQNMQTTCRS